MTPLNRRTALTTVAALTMPSLGWAQVDRSAIRLLVGFAPGGGTDLVARQIAEKLRGELATQVLVENMAGAGGRLAANALHTAAPDGLTYMVTNDAVMAFQTLLFGDQIKWNYKRDFIPVGAITSYPLGLAVPSSLNINSVQELVAWLRANPSKANFGNTGLGGVTHFLGFDLGRSIGIELKPAPYRGASPMVTDLVGGHIPMAIGLMDDMLKFHRAGSVKVLGIFSAQRSPLIPDIPTLREQGIKTMAAEGWQSVWAPARTPAATVERMASALKKVLDMPELQQAMTSKLNVQPRFRSGDEVLRLLDEQITLWSGVIKASGFKPE